MTTEEQNIRTITIKRSPAKDIGKIQRHERIDKTLAALVAVGGLIWIGFTGVNYWLEQKETPIPYQDDIKIIERLYNQNSINETSNLIKKDTLPARGYFLLL